MDRVVTLGHLIETSTPAIAIIPARGGSKSIPRKNIRALGGRPLIEWSIAAARAASTVERVIVSTDDAAIRDVAVACGAEAPFLRPPQLALDDTTDFPVIAHALEWLAECEHLHPDLVVQLRPTTPLRPRGLVDAAVRALRHQPGADSLRAVTHASQNPYKMWTLHDGLLRPLLSHDGPEPYNMPRQQLPDTFWQTGHIDVIRTSTIRQGSLTGRHIAPLHVPSRFAIDLDTEEQWEHAEWLALRHRDAIVVPAVEPRVLQRYRLLALDFDGVLTNNAVSVNSEGDEIVQCDRSDGLGLAMLGARGFPIVVLSTEAHPVVGARCRKLRLPYRQGLSNKADALRSYADECGVALRDVIYVGNDVNDRECLHIAGLAVVPSDAHPAVMRSADWILSRAGGRGAVREVCDALLEATPS